MRQPRDLSKSRDTKQILDTARILVFSSMKRLLFSKTTFGLLLLCMIPIIVFSLWVGGVFPEETTNLYENRKGDYNNLYTTQVMDLQNKYTGISIIKNELNITVEITQVEIQPPAPPEKENSHKIYIKGITTGNVSNLNLFILFYIYDYSLPFNFSIAGPIENENLKFIGLGVEGLKYWQHWELELKNLTIPRLDDALLQSMGINLENFQGDESPVRLGLLVQAIDNSSMNESGIIWNFGYEEIYVEFDDESISDYGIVGRDIKKKIIDISGYDVFNTVAPHLYFIVIIPLITILYSISVLREDIENHNIVYLISRPISKAEILLFKFKGFFFSTWLLVAISMIVSFIIIVFSELGETIKFEYLTNILMISTLNILVYGALFFIFTLLTSYPIILSLLFVFVWENILSTLPSVLNRISIIYWIKALGYRLLPEVGITNVYLPLSVFESTVVLIVLTIAFLMIAILLFYNKEFS